jgi:hypothetical protein
MNLVKTDFGVWVFIVFTILLFISYFVAERIDNDYKNNKRK